MSLHFRLTESPASSLTAIECPPTCKRCSSFTEIGARVLDQKVEIAASLEGVVGRQDVMDEESIPK